MLSDITVGTVPTYLIQSACSQNVFMHKAAYRLSPTDGSLKATGVHYLFPVNASKISITL